MLGTFLKGATAVGGEVTFISSSKAVISNSNDITVTAPSPIQQNDIILALLYENNTAGRTFTYPAGFSEEFLYNTTAPNISVAWKLATSSEPASYTFSRSGVSTGRFRVILLVYRGANTTTPLQVGTQNIGSSTTTGSTNAITPNDTGKLVAFFGSTSSSIIAQPTTPTDMTFREWAFATGGAAGQIVAFDQNIESLSSIAAKTTAFAGSGTTIGLALMVLKA
jgi:hypothetical protein